MSSIIKSMGQKLSEKMKEADASTQKKLVGSFSRNQRMAAILETAGESWPKINDTKLDPGKRVDELDELIHATAVPSGRIKQTGWYGLMIGHWQRIHGAWQNFVELDMQGLIPDEDIPTIRIPLKDGTVLVVRDKDSGSILSKKEHDLRLKLEANAEIIPAGKFAWAWGISDDRDVSDQWSLWIQQGPQQQQPGLAQPAMTAVQTLGGPNVQRPTRGGGQYAPRNPTQ